MNVNIEHFPNDGLVNCKSEMAKNNKNTTIITEILPNKFPKIRNASKFQRKIKAMKEIYKERENSRDFFYENICAIDKSAKNAMPQMALWDLSQSQFPTFPCDEY